MNNSVSEVVLRVIANVAATLATNGFQELDKAEYGGVSTFGYVRSSLINTAYYAVWAYPGFDMTLNEFYAAVVQAEKQERAA